MKALFTILIFAIGIPALGQLSVQSGTGFEFFIIKPGRNLNSTIQVALIDQSILRANVFGLSSTRQSGTSPIEAVIDNKAVLALGSGFVTSFSPLVPNGFLKIQDREINPVNPSGYEVIIGVDSKGRLRLHSKYAKSEIAALSAGFQVGPMLLQDGKKQQIKHNKFTRSFLGLTGDNKVVVGISLEAVDLNDISLFLLDPPNEYKRLKCINAVNLAGGGSEALVVSKISKSGNFNLKGASLLAFTIR